MSVRETNTPVPDPPSRIGLLLQELARCLPFVFMHGIGAGFDVDGDELVRVLLHVDVRANALLENDVAPPGKLVVGQILCTHGVKENL